MKRNDKGRGGRGIYARVDIKKGRIIEKSPCIILHNNNGILSWYVFAWTKQTSALALGYGSLFNHSYAANAEYELCKPDLIIFRAYRNIKTGEEITINYNGHPYDQSPYEF